MKQIGYGKDYRYVHNDPTQRRDGMPAGTIARQKVFFEKNKPR